MNGGEPRLRGCIGTLEARWLINGFRDYALNRYFHKTCTWHVNLDNIYDSDLFMFIYIFMVCAFHILILAIGSTLEK